MWVRMGGRRYELHAIWICKQQEQGAGKMRHEYEMIYIYDVGRRRNLLLGTQYSRSQECILCRQNESCTCPHIIHARNQTQGWNLEARKMYSYLGNLTNTVELRSQLNIHQIVANPARLIIPTVSPIILPIQRPVIPNLRHLLLLLPNLLLIQNLHRVLIPDVAQPTPHGRRAHKITPPFKHAAEVPRFHNGRDRFPQHRERHRRTDKQQLQQGVDLADLRGPNLRRRQREVPVAGEGFRFRQRDPAEVDGGAGQQDVAADDDGGEPEGDGGLDGEGDDGDGHEEFVGHGVDDGADDGGLVEAAGEVAVDRVGEAGVEE